MANNRNANVQTLGDRMNEYEAVTTSYSLIKKIPVYARIDGRAFHTFCHGLIKPFDMDMVKVMQQTTAYLVEKTNAAVGYVQSDEISLAWTEPSKMPFETRLFKLESVLAAMATSAFTLYGLNTSLKSKIEKMFPHFDCRVCQLPDMQELANMFMFREKDCIKNSITMVALSKLGHNKLHNKNSDDKIQMLAELGLDYDKDIDEDLRVGAYFHRENYMKTLSDAEVAKIPENKRDLDLFGKMNVMRSHVVQFKLGQPLHAFSNKVDVLFKS